MRSWRENKSESNHWNVKPTLSFRITERAIENYKDAAKIQDMSERHDLAAVDAYIVDLHRLIYEL